MATKLWIFTLEVKLIAIFFAFALKALVSWVGGCTGWSVVLEPSLSTIPPSPELGLAARIKPRNRLFHTLPNISYIPPFFYRTSLKANSFDVLEVLEPPKLTVHLKAEPK